MDITPVVSAEFQLIASYGDGQFNVSGVVHDGNVLILPRETLPFPNKDVADFTIDDFRAVIATEPKTRILLIGTGHKTQFLPKALRQALREEQIVPEIMDTGAAARTYNVLITEGREVAALLLAI